MCENSCPGCSTFQWREYDDVNLRHGQLQDGYDNMRQEFETLRAENKKLRFFYTNIGQLIFFTGLTSVISEWLLRKIMGGIERIGQKFSVEELLLVRLMKLRLTLIKCIKNHHIKYYAELCPCYGSDPQDTC